MPTTDNGVLSQFTYYDLKYTLALTVLSVLLSQITWFVVCPFYAKYYALYFKAMKSLRKIFTSSHFCSNIKIFAT